MFQKKSEPCGITAEAGGEQETWPRWWQASQIHMLDELREW